MKTKTKWITVALLILLSIVMAFGFNPLKKRYQRYVCGTNLRGLGNAQTVYANDYDDTYAIGGHSPNEPYIMNDPNLPVMLLADPNRGL